MNKTLILFLFALLAALSNTVSGQSKVPQRTAQDIKSMLCHKWKLTHMEANGKRMALPPEMGEATVTFKSDGTLIETDEGQKFGGKWTYFHKSMTLLIDDKDGKQKQNILKLTPTQLILKSDYKGLSMNMIMKKID